MGSALFLRNAEADLTLALSATQRATRALPNREVEDSKAAEALIASALELVTGIRKRVVSTDQPPGSSER